MGQQDSQNIGEIGRLSTCGVDDMQLSNLMKQFASSPPPPPPPPPPLPPPPLPPPPLWDS